MTGKELIRKVFALEQTERIPWVPFVGCHGGFLNDVSAKQYLKSARQIETGISKAIELYKPDGIPVMFDLQVEAEALGCQLHWSDDSPPAVIDHPLANGKELKDLSLPGPEEGRIKTCIEATKALRKKHPDVALYGLITGPFTLALHLLGTDIFMKMFEDPEPVNELLDFCSEVGKRMSKYYIDAGCDIIAVVDPMTSQIDPGSFEMVVSKPATELFEYIRKQNALSSFFVCGHAQQNIEVMCKCKPDNISIDENIPLDFVKDIALKHHISFGGNMKLTVVLLMGSEEDSQKNALDCMDLAGSHGFILAPGCDLPMKTPVKNLQAVAELVHDPYQQDIIRTLEKKETELELLNMKDYGQSDKVVVDIITLDSESCAPCQYMVEAVKKVAPHFEGIVEWREHPIKQLDAVTFMSSLMVKNIPTICIDGKIAFVSQIPPKHDLIAAIQKRINEKLRLKIKSKKGEILILCRENQDCTQLKTNIDKAIGELGKTIAVTTISDDKKIQSYGVTETPSIILAEYKLKSQGDIPAVDIIKEWIKEI